MTALGNRPETVEAWDLDAAGGPALTRVQTPLRRGLRIGESLERVAGKVHEKLAERTQRARAEAEAEAERVRVAREIANRIGELEMLGVEVSRDGWTPVPGLDNIEIPEVGAETGVVLRWWVRHRATEESAPQALTVTIVGEVPAPRLLPILNRCVSTAINPFRECWYYAEPRTYTVEGDDDVKISGHLYAFYPLNNP